MRKIEVYDKHDDLVDEWSFVDFCCWFQLICKNENCDVLTRNDDTIQIFSGLYKDKHGCTWERRFKISED